MRDCHVDCDLTAHISLQIPSISKSQRQKQPMRPWSCWARPPLDVSMFFTAAAAVFVVTLTSSPPVRGYLGFSVGTRKRFFRESAIFSARAKKPVKQRVPGKDIALQRGVSLPEITHRPGLPAPCAGVFGDSVGTNRGIRGDSPLRAWNRADDSGVWVGRFCRVAPCRPKIAARSGGIRGQTGKWMRSTARRADQNRTGPTRGIMLLWRLRQNRRIRRGMRSATSATAMAV